MDGIISARVPNSRMQSGLPEIRVGVISASELQAEINYVRAARPTSHHKGRVGGLWVHKVRRHTNLE